MRRTAFALLVTLAACGGGQSADRDALRDRAEQLFPNAANMEELIDAYAETCEMDDDQTFAITVNMAQAEDANRVELLRAACPDRVADALNERD